MNLLRKIYMEILRRRNSVAWARYMGVKIGDNTMISPYVCFSSEPYLITIGSHVQITDNVCFFTHGGGNVIRKEYPDFDCFGKIVIENWVYVGSHSLIMPGVVIGEGSLVGAGSVVTKSVPPGVVVAGNPARIIGNVKDYMKRNLKYNVHSKFFGKVHKEKYLLSLPEDCFIKR